MIDEKLAEAVDRVRSKVDRGLPEDYDVRRERERGILALERLREGTFPDNVKAAQSAVVTALVGGYFDEFDGKQWHESMIGRFRDLVEALLAGAFGDVKVYVVSGAGLTHIVVAPGDF